MPQMAALLAKLSQAFQLDPSIDEYALVPCASGALFGLPSGEEDEGCVAVEHKLAISFEAAVVLYRHSRCRLAALRTEAACSSTRTALAAASQAALLCCADFATAWACREELLGAGALDLEEELRFVALLLRTNHKSGETWAYRRCLLNKALRGDTGRGPWPPEIAAAVVHSELALVEELARKYDHHYYAWNHWAWLGRLLAERAQRGGNPGSPAAVPPRAEPLAPLDLGFPRLAHATPSHYGLFHHRLVRLQATLHGDREAATGSTDEAAGPVEGEVLIAAEFGLAARAFAAYAEERRLAESLLSTFPHLEAPWAFRLQLFAVLLEAVEAGTPAVSAQAPALVRVGDLWRSETAFAANAELEAHTAGSAAEQATAAEAAGRFARRFKAHLLQELAAHLLELAPRHATCRGSFRRMADRCQEALHVLHSLEAAAEASAAPVVLRGIRADLEAAARLAVPAASPAHADAGPLVPAAAATAA